MATAKHFKTTSPHALSQFKAFQDAVQQWKADVEEFHTRMGAQSAYGGVRHGKAVIQGLQFTGSVPARWKQDGRGHAPYKNNPVRAEFDALTRRVLNMDGIVNDMLLELPNGQMIFASPSLFEHDGALYLTYGEQQVTIENSDWEAISAGDYTIARGLFQNALDAQPE